MIINNKAFDLINEVYIMGILNVTPDSFSDGGNCYSDGKLDRDMVLRKTEKLINHGAAIIDVGGESTRPGYTRISDEEETERVCPVIEAVVSNFDVAISVDTYKSVVAENAIKSGAGLINDIWGFKADEKIAEVTAKYKVPCCLMHNRDISANPYNNFLRDILKDLKESIEIAHKAGITDDKIIVDPGVGFGKSLENNLDITANVEILHTLSYPILLGTSRKSMIGLTLDLPVDEREEGTMATTVAGVMKGCSIIRVHDVKKNYRAAKMALALRNHEIK